MNINLTLIAEMIVFLVFVLISKKFVWPLIINPLHERKTKIADGLAAAERGVHEQELAEKRAIETLREAKEQASEIIARAEKRASEIVDESKGDARVEGERLVTAAKAEIEQEVQRAKETLRVELGAIVITGAEKILEREVNASVHDDMIKTLAAQIKETAQMSELNTIARPYAQAAFDLAREAKALVQWSDMLGFAAQVAGDADMRAAIDSPGMSTAQQAELFNQACGDNIDDHARNFVKLLAENRRLTLFPEIAALFDTLRADAEGTLEATVISAMPLNDAQQQQIVDGLKARFNREIALQVETDASILGGAIIRAGDTVIDGSLRGRLEKFAYALH